MGLQHLFYFGGRGRLLHLVLLPGFLLVHVIPLLLRPLDIQDLSKLIEHSLFVVVAQFVIIRLQNAHDTSHGFARLGRKARLLHLIEE